MRYRTFVAAFAIALTLAPVVAAADATADAKKAIIASYAKQSVAIPKGDFSSYASTHTKDFYETDKQGRKQTLAELQQVMPVVAKMMKGLKRSVTVQSVRLSGKTATVAATERVEGQLTNPQTKKLATLQAERSMTDTWVLTGGKWLRKLSATTIEKQTIDGKPFATGR